MQSSEATRLSQDRGSLFSEPCGVGTAPQIGQEDDELTPIIPPTATPDSSVSRGRSQGQPRGRRKTVPRNSRWTGAKNDASIVITGSWSSPWHYSITAGGLQELKQAPGLNRSFLEYYLSGHG